MVIPSDYTGKPFFLIQNYVRMKFMDFFLFLFIFQELHPDKLPHGWFLLNFYEKLTFFINGHVIYHFSKNFLQIPEILTENKHFYCLRVQIMKQC